MPRSSRISDSPRSRSSILASTLALDDVRGNARRRERRRYRSAPTARGAGYGRLLSGVLRKAATSGTTPLAWPRAKWPPDSRPTNVAPGNTVCGLRGGLIAGQRIVLGVNDQRRHLDRLQRHGVNLGVGDERAKIAPARRGPSGKMLSTKSPITSACSAFCGKPAGTPTSRLIIGRLTVSSIHIAASL